ncbi:MAG TPA: branched-chain amino acid ABC transporter permease [Geminicoccaceae bacterium]|nr:branched-chain amino acid ABC transporter permease [Geminicoccaceae bacterium]
MAVDARQLWRVTLSFTLLLAPAGCARLDAEQARLCERVIPAVEEVEAPVEILRSEPDPSAAHGVVVRYRVAEPAGQAPAHWIACRFGGGGFERDRLTLTGVTTDQAGALSDIQVYLLRQYWLGLYEGQAQAATGEAPQVQGPTRDLLYACQLAVNALTVGCLYGLLAIGYSLVYGIVGKINLAFGEIAIVGAYAAFIGVALFALLGAGTVPLAVFALLLVVAAVGGVHGLATERLVFRPLRETPSQAPLIATVGLAILLQEYLRLTQGAADRWIQPVFSEAHELADGAGFTVTVSTSQVLILGLTGGLYAGLWLLMARSSFGRQARACADDALMAAFCGINVERVTALTFSLGAVYAAIAGFVVLIRYGGVRFYDGFVLGFKALTAAILGGIGSVPGAMLGGLLIGALETFWAGYFSIAYKDVAVFGLLAAILVWRPQGLLGQPVRLANDRFVQRRP